MVQEGKRGLQNFQLIIFTITYILSMVFLYILAIQLLKDLGAAFIILATLLFLTLGVLIWSFLFIMYTIPHRLAGEFDPVKNKVSTGETKDAESFAIEINTFLSEFFNFSFMDIRHSSLKSVNTKIMHSCMNLEDRFDWEAIDKEASGKETAFSNGKCLVGEKNCFAYTIPIHFNNKYLGFFTVFAAQPLGKLRLNYLLDLEENFIDDQLIRFIPREEII